VKKILGEIVMDVVYKTKKYDSPEYLRMVEIASNLHKEMKDKKQERTINGVDYLLVPGEIKVGDLYYFAFLGRVDEYKDVDYGSFDPNNMKHAWRVVIK